jgi:mannose-6-phosphate isomerase
MSADSKIFRLEGKVQHYAWGGNRFIPGLLGQNNDSDKPFAEYWMGAHENVPSIVVLPDGGRQPLNEFIKRDAEGILGKAVYDHFGRLPYLFKVLDVKDMLSIQVHPTKKDAVAAFAAENKKGIALNAPGRNYKDDNHKPELMYALSDFYLLHGFKEPEALKAILLSVPELQFLQPVFEKESYEGLYKKVMTMDQQEVNRLLYPLLDRIVPMYEKGQLKKDQEDFWAARAAGTFNQPGVVDRGIFSVYFFNLVYLKPGETIFQDAGIPHAYLEGQNMELMANSDNVLRGGLTVKHIDVEELMKHVRFEPVVPGVIKGKRGEVEQEEVFPTPAGDFELTELSLVPGRVPVLRPQTTEIFFVYSGSIEAIEKEQRLALKRGEAMLATAGAKFVIYPIENSKVFRATVPL